MAKAIKLTEITPEELKICVREIFVLNRGEMLIESIKDQLIRTRVECSDQELQVALFGLVDDGIISRDVTYSYSGFATISFKSTLPRSNRVTHYVGGGCNPAHTMPD